MIGLITARRGKQSAAEPDADAAESEADVADAMDASDAPDDPGIDAADENAGPADDLSGSPDAREMTVEATVDNILSVTDFVNDELDKLDCPIKAKTQIDIAIDELFGNIAHYAYDPETGPATVRVEVERDPLAVVITFMDHGKPYDPLSADDPDVTLSAEERKIGGLGVFLVKNTMDDVSYEYKNGHNILRIKKNIRGK